MVRNLNGGEGIASELSSEDGTLLLAASLLLTAAAALAPSAALLQRLEALKAASEEQAKSNAALAKSNAALTTKVAQLNAQFNVESTHDAPVARATQSIRISDSDSPDWACPCSTSARPCPPKNESFNPNAGACCHGPGPAAPCETAVWTREMCSSVKGNTWCPANTRSIGASTQ